MTRSDPQPPRPRSTTLWIGVILTAVPLLISAHSTSRETADAGRRIALRLFQNVGLRYPRPAPFTPSVVGSCPTLDDVLAAIHQVESGGCPDLGAGAVGDDGLAIGPFQIHRAYWRDSGLAGRYDDCFDAGYARQVVLRYWERYCPEALHAVDAEVLARVHNGGPRGAGKQRTLSYWHKVERTLSTRAARVEIAGL